MTVTVPGCAFGIAAKTSGALARCSHHERQLTSQALWQALIKLDAHGRGAPPWRAPRPLRPAPGDLREVFQELGQGLPCFEVIEQRRERHASADEHRRAAHDLWVAVNDRVGLLQPRLLALHRRAERPATRCSPAAISVHATAGPRLGNRQRTYSVEGLQKLMSWRISLERAYQMVVMPKLQTERASIAQQEREKVLKEL